MAISAATQLVIGDCHSPLAMTERQAYFLVKTLFFIMKTILFLKFKTYLVLDNSHEAAYVPSLLASHRKALL